MLELIRDIDAQVCVTLGDGGGVVRGVMLPTVELPLEVHGFTQEHTHGFINTHNTSS